ncbi:glycosyltransferase [Sphingobacterium hotanense]|uniref:glycosyltransferase n=1 Tax=Sphingobacterium hotanense TaxID=649196 RepID=UPI0021A62BB8|nr:glycosyltransferase [Sphingobacterium hotanense]MCT1523547.1 glycosyltransferase [Sphingobacterium hotanense]
MSINRSSIFIIFHGPFPKGNVSTLRVLSYAKAFNDNGCKVNVIIPSPIKSAKINSSDSGDFFGISYEYIMGKNWKGNSNEIQKGIIYLFGLIRISIKIIRERPAIVMTYDSEPIRNLILGLVCKLLGIKVGMDITEYPKGYKQFSRFRKWFEKFSLFGFKKIITITNELVYFYENWLNVKCFLLPVTINPNRFENIRMSAFDSSYFLCVFGTHNRDSIIDTIRGYILYFKKFEKQKFDLYLLGDFKELLKNFPENIEILKLIKAHNLENKIRFLGPMEADKVPNYILNSMCLITTPREFVSGGFPTKLAEYLLSGKPVIASNVGELSNYLIDNETIYFVSPKADEELARKMIQIQDNLAEANKVGNMGREMALKVFNAATYTADLIKYFEK